MEFYTDHPLPSQAQMLSYPDRSVFRAKLADKGDPQMMDPKYKNVSADFLRRANEDYGDTSPSLLCFLSCSIMFIMPFMSFMNFMWPKPEPGAVMCGWNDMSEGRILKFGDDAPTVGEEELTAR